MQTPHLRPRINATSFLLWGDRDNHWATLLEISRECQVTVVYVDPTDSSWCWQGSEIRVRPAGRGEWSPSTCDCDSSSAFGGPTRSRLVLGEAKQVSAGEGLGWFSGCSPSRVCSAPTGRRSWSAQTSSTMSGSPGRFSQCTSGRLWAPSGEPVRWVDCGTTQYHDVTQVLEVWLHGFLPSCAVHRGQWLRVPAAGHPP